MQFAISQVDILSSIIAVDKKNLFSTIDCLA